MRKFLAPLVGAFLLLGSPFALAGECNQGTASDFRNMVNSDAEARDAILTITELSPTEALIAFAVVNVAAAHTDQKFEGAIFALRKDGVSFLIPTVGGQICGMFTLQPQTTGAIMKALQGVNA